MEQLGYRPFDADNHYYEALDAFSRHLDEVLELMGADRVIFGSDWPHIEALPEPLHYLRDVAHLDEVTQRQVLLENAIELNRLRPG